MTFKIFLSRYVKSFLKNLENPFIGFANPFFLLLGCAKRINIDFEYDTKGWWKVDDFYVVGIY
jgi:hypothetical protein